MQRKKKKNPQKKCTNANNFKKNDVKNAGKFIDYKYWGWLD